MCLIYFSPNSEDFKLKVTLKSLKMVYFSLTVNFVMMVLNKYLTGWSLCSYETGCFGSTMGHKDHTVRKHNVREVGVVVIHHQSSRIQGCQCSHFGPRTQTVWETSKEVHLHPLWMSVTKQRWWVWHELSATYNANLRNFPEHFNTHSHLASGDLDSSYEVQKMSSQT